LASLPISGAQAQHTIHSMQEIIGCKASNVHQKQAMIEELVLAWMDCVYSSKDISLIDIISEASNSIFFLPALKLL